MSSEYGSRYGICFMYRQSRMFYVPINGKWLKLCNECWENESEKIVERSDLKIFMRSRLTDEKSEICDKLEQLFWDETEFTHDKFKGENIYDLYEFEIFIDGIKVYPK